MQVCFNDTNKLAAIATDTETSPTFTEAGHVAAPAGGQWGRHSPSFCACAGWHGSRVPLRGTGSGEEQTRRRCAASRGVDPGRRLPTGSHGYLHSVKQLLMFKETNEHATTSTCFRDHNRIRIMMCKNRRSRECGSSFYFILEGNV